MVRTRRRSLVLTLLVLASLLGAPLLGAVPAAAQVGDTPPDLPAMLLRTDQIAEAGFEEQFFPYSGNCYTPEQEAQKIAESRGLDSEDVLGLLTDFGWQRTCELLYALPGEGSGAPPVVVGITSYVHLYEDVEGAEAGFEFFEDERHRPNAEDLTEGDDLGDQSEATVSHGSDNTDEFQLLDLTFRLDNLVAGVMIHDYSGEAPDYEMAEELAGLLQGRIETVLDEGGPGLSTLVLQMEGEDLPPTSTNRYFVIEGEGEQGETETDEAFEARMDRYGRADAVYTATQRIPAGSDETTDDYLYGVTLYQFQSERTASKWLDDVPQHLEANPDVFDVTIREEAPQFGDESLAIGRGETLSSGQPVIYDNIYARIGDIGLIIGFRGPTIPEGIAEEVIEAQIECIEEGECTETVPVPDVLLAGITFGAPTPEEEETPEDVETPEDEEEAPEATETARDDTGDAEVYESPAYGYTLTYDPNEWEILVEDDDPDDPYDMIYLFNGIGFVGLTGDPDYAETELDRCIDDYGQSLEQEAGVSEVEPLRGRGNAGVEEGVTWATYAYVYTDDDGEESESIRYYECRAIGEGITVVIMHDAPADEFEEEVEAREELLEGLEAGS